MPATGYFANTVGAANLGASTAVQGVRGFFAGDFNTPTASQTLTAIDKGPINYDTDVSYAPPASSAGSKLLLLVAVAIIVVIVVRR